MATVSSPDNMESTRRETARHQVERLKGFYIHLAIYLLVNIGLCALNILKTPDHLWFYWVAIGWGIGVSFHAFRVFGGSVGGKWEERKIQEFMKKQS